MGLSSDLLENAIKLVNIVLLTSSSQSPTNDNASDNAAQAESSKD